MVSTGCRGFELRAEVPELRKSRQAFIIAEENYAMAA